MIYSNDEVKERFAPQLNEPYATRFRALVNRIDQAFPHYRRLVVQAELDGLAVEEYEIENAKYEASLSTIIDLSQQGWDLLVEDHELYLRMPAHEATDKQNVRALLSSERKAQSTERKYRRPLLFQNNRMYGIQPGP